MKVYEKISRYFLGVWCLIGAVDGWAMLLFNIHFMDPEKLSIFLKVLVNTTYFWAFLKIIQTIGAISLLVNYKPALGFILITPISAILCLFYLFELKIFIPIGILIVISSLILFRAYSKSFMPLLDSYPR